MSKYTEYKRDSIRLAKIVVAVEQAQAGGSKANTVNLSPDGNYRMRFVVEDGNKIVVWTERYIPGVGYTKV